VRGLMGVLIATTPLEGSLNTLFCATSPLAAERGKGAYFTPVGKVDAKAKRFLEDSEGNGQLWRYTEAVVERLG